MIIAYLAGPIDYEIDKGEGWKKEFMARCKSNLDIGFYDPYGPFKFNKVDRPMAKYIHDVNMIALEQADILVGSLMKGQTSVGTPIEFYHVMNKKPMFILTDMAESVYMQYIGRGAEFFTNIDELCRAVLGRVEKFKNEELETLGTILKGTSKTGLGQVRL